MQPSHSFDQVSSKKSQKSNSHKEVDPRHTKGNTFEIEMLQLLMSHDLLPKNISQKKFQYPSGEDFLNDV